MLCGRVRVVEELRLGPVDKVGRAGGHNGALALNERAVVLAVEAGARVVEGEVLGIEVAFGDDWIGVHQFPAQSVGRLKDVESFLSQWPAAGDGFIARVLGALGVGVFEDGKAVSADAGPNDVVLFGALEIDEPELGFGPVDAILALGGAGEFWVGRLFRFLVVMGTAVVHAEALAVPEHGIIGGCISFPWRIGGERHFFRHGLLDDLVRVPQKFVDEEKIDEKLAVVAELAENQWLGGASGNQEVEDDEELYDQFFHKGESYGPKGPSSMTLQ